jgi:hypothetical protein
MKTSIFKVSFVFALLLTLSTLAHAQLVPPTPVVAIGVTPGVALPNPQVLNAGLMLYSENYLPVGYIAPTTLGNNSVAIGLGNQAQSFGEIATGAFSTLYTPIGGTGMGNINLSDRQFVVGNGQNSSNRKDAFTILKSGRSAIGINNFEVINGLSALTVRGITGGNNQVTEVLRVEDGTNPNSYCSFEPNSSGIIGCTSDRTMKHNIVSLEKEGSLQKVAQLNPVTFNWNSDEKDETPIYGFIAQEVQKVVPEAVQTDRQTGKLKLFQLTLLPILTSALQEVNTKLDMTIIRLEGISSEKVTTKEVCLGTTCITETELQKILEDSRNR